MSVSYWHTDELNVAKLRAVKRPVVNDSFWPLGAGHDRWDLAEIRPLYNLKLGIFSVCFGDVLEQKTPSTLAIYSYQNKFKPEYLVAY